MVRVTILNCWIICSDAAHHINELFSARIFDILVVRESLKHVYKLLSVMGASIKIECFELDDIKRLWISKARHFNRFR